jgi:hypothetical protein
VAKDDWRIRIHFEEPAHAGGLLERLGLSLGGEAADLAQQLKSRRLAVSFDEDDVFVYAGSRAEAESAQEVVQAVLREHEIDAHSSGVEHWLPEEERWDDEPPTETWEEEQLESGHAPWEVRVESDSHGAATELADRLEAEGYGVERRWKFLIVGCATKEDAAALAERLHGEVAPGGELVWETAPGNPFALFGGLGSSGTPL